MLCAAFFSLHCYDRKGRLVLPAKNTTLQRKLLLVRLFRPSDSVRKILRNSAEFSGGHIMRQKRSIMRQIMRFL